MRNSIREYESGSAASLEGNLTGEAALELMCRL
jgi:hypothetical protein